MRKYILKNSIKKKHESEKHDEKKSLNKRTLRKKEFTTFETLGKASCFLGDLT
jgi:hypothetical protein